MQKERICKARHDLVLGFDRSIHPSAACRNSDQEEIAAPEAKDSISIISTRNWNYFASNHQPCADLIKVVTIAAIKKDDQNPFFEGILKQ